MTAPKISKEVSDLLSPDWLKNRADDEDELSTKPKAIKADPSEIEKLLCPDDLLEKVDPLAGTVGELIPDENRTPEDFEKYGKAKAKTPTAEKESDSGGEVRISLGEWLEKQAKAQTKKAESEKFEQEIESRKAEDENREIKESFRRVAAKMKADDLTPDRYKDQE